MSRSIWLLLGSLYRTRTAAARYRKAQDQLVGARQDLRASMQAARAEGMTLAAIRARVGLLFAGAATSEFFGYLAGFADLLHEGEVLELHEQFGYFDAVDVGRLVSWSDEESSRVGAHALVVDAGERDDLGAFEPGALADERDDLDVAGNVFGNILYTVVRLPECVFVLGDARRGRCFSLHASFVTVARAPKHAWQSRQPYGTGPTPATTVGPPTAGGLDDAARSGRIAGRSESTSLATAATIGHARRP
jgi:hypothetical protein